VIDQVFSNLRRNSPSCRTPEVRLDRLPEETFLESGGAVIRAAIVHAVREEMALKLSDIVFRRGSLGTVPRPARALVEEIARVAGAELGWDTFRQEAETEEVMRQFGVPGYAVEAVG
jgi:glycerol-3-phosphate dehydrogenase